MSLFKSEADRNLWIKLNAEHQIDWEKNITYFDKESGEHKPTHQALNPRSMEDAIEIAKNQLAYDEKEGKLRYTLEEYLTLNRESLEAIRLKQYQETFKDFPLK